MQTQGKQIYHLILLRTPSLSYLLTFSLNTKLCLLASDHMNALQLKSALQAARGIYVHTTLVDYTPF